jgi:hypothetical protein
VRQHPGGHPPAAGTRSARQPRHVADDAPRGPAREGGSDPARADPVRADPARTDPVRADPARTDLDHRLPESPLPPEPSERRVVRTQQRVLAVIVLRWPVVTHRRVVVEEQILFETHQERVGPRPRILPRT